MNCYITEGSTSQKEITDFKQLSYYIYQWITGEYIICTIDRHDPLPRIQRFLSSVLSKKSFIEKFFVNIEEVYITSKGGCVLRIELDYLNEEVNWMQEGF